MRYSHGVCVCVCFTQLGGWGTAVRTRAAHLKARTIPTIELPSRHHVTTAVIESMMSPSDMARDWPQPILATRAR